MARYSRVASRYARAIFDWLKSDEKNVRSVITDLEKFAKLLESHSDLFLLSSGRLFSESDRNAVLSDIADRLKFNESTRKILFLLSKSRRLTIVSELISSLKEQLFASLDIVPIVVETRDDLGAEDKKRIEKRFQTLFGKKIEPRFIVASSLIGGVRVLAQGKSYEGSMAGWMSQLEERLLEGSV